MTRSVEFATGRLDGPVLRKQQLEAAAGRSYPYNVVGVGGKGGFPAGHGRYPYTGVAGTEFPAGHGCSSCRDLVRSGDGYVCIPFSRGELVLHTSCIRRLSRQAMEDQDYYMRQSERIKSLYRRG